MIEKSKSDLNVERKKIKYASYFFFVRLMRRRRRCNGGRTPPEDLFPAFKDEVARLQNKENT